MKPKKTEITGIVTTRILSANLVNHSSFSKFSAKNEDTLNHHVCLALEIIFSYPHKVVVAVIASYFSRVAVGNWKFSNFGTLHLNNITTI